MNVQKSSRLEISTRGGKEGREHGVSQLAGSPNDPLDSHFSTLKMELEQDFGLYYSIIGGEDPAGTFDLWKEREPTIGGHSGRMESTRRSTCGRMASGFSKWERKRIWIIRDS